MEATETTTERDCSFDGPQELIIELDAGNLPEASKHRIGCYVLQLAQWSPKSSNDDWCAEWDVVGPFGMVLIYAESMAGENRVHAAFIGKGEQMVCWNATPATLTPTSLCGLKLTGAFGDILIRDGSNC